MKTRIDFVTNSSSSSYIIAYKKMPEVDKETLEKYPWMINCMNMIEQTLMMDSDYSDTDTGVICTSEEELDEEFISRYGWRGEKTIEEIVAHDDEGMYEFYQNLIKYINNGYSIIFKRIDYHDHTYQDVINNMADDVNIIIVEGD